MTTEYRTEPQDIDVLAFIKTRYMGATATLPPRVMVSVMPRNGDHVKKAVSTWSHASSVEDNHMRSANYACIELGLMDLSLSKRKAWVYGYYTGGEGNYVLASVANDGYIILEDSGQPGENALRTTCHDSIVQVFDSRKSVELDGEDREHELEGTTHVFKIRRVTR